VHVEAGVDQRESLLSLICLFFESRVAVDPFRSHVGADHNNRICKPDSRAALSRVLVGTVAHLVELPDSHAVSRGKLVEQNKLRLGVDRLEVLIGRVPGAGELQIQGTEEGGLAFVRHTGIDPEVALLLAVLLAVWVPDRHKLTPTIWDKTLTRGSSLFKAAEILAEGLKVQLHLGVVLQEERVLSSHSCQILISGVVHQRLVEDLGVSSSGLLSLLPVGFTLLQVVGVLLDVDRHRLRRSSSLVVAVVTLNVKAVRGLVVHPILDVKEDVDVRSTILVELSSYNYVLEFLGGELELKCIENNLLLERALRVGEEELVGVEAEALSGGLLDVLRRHIHFH